MKLRPSKLIFVAGTDTDVGKTWTICQLASSLIRKGYKVSAKKPVQSFTPSEFDQGVTDAHLLAESTGESIDSICSITRMYGMPLAPPIAALRLGLPSFTVADLVTEIAWDAGVDFGILESAGGICSPIAIDGDVRDLISLVLPDILVLVVDSCLGAIHRTISALDSLKYAHQDEFSSYRSVIFLNRFKESLDLHRENLEWLTRNLDLPVFTDTVQLGSFLCGESDRFGN